MGKHRGAQDRRVQVPVDGSDWKALHAARRPGLSLQTAAGLCQVLWRHRANSMCPQREMRDKEQLTWLGRLACLNHRAGLQAGHQEGTKATRGV